MKEFLISAAGNRKVTAEIASYLPNGSVLGIDNSENMILLRVSFQQVIFLI